jgi:hypothetical protein
MTTYATHTDLEAYIEGGSGLDAATADRLLERAERDVDYAAGGWPVVDPTAGLKFTPSALQDWQAAALNRATCAQAEYRLTMGEDFMVKAQYTRVQGPDFRVFGELPYIGPKTMRELASGGLLRPGPGYGMGSVGTGPARRGGGGSIVNL